MSKLLDIMKEYGADTEGVLDRFMDDEELYETCLKEFVDTTNLSELINRIEAKSYDEAFEIAHAFKGVSGNLGLTPLFEVACVLVEALRGKTYDNLKAQFKDVDDRYKEFLSAYEKVK